MVSLTFVNVSTESATTIFDHLIIRRGRTRDKKLHLPATKIYKTYGIASLKVFEAVQFDISVFCQVALPDSIIGARCRRRVPNK